MALWRYTFDSLTNLTANLLSSIFPFNQLFKLYHLAPRKHQHQHRHPTNESSMDPGLPLKLEKLTTMPATTSTSRPSLADNNLEIQFRTHSNRRSSTQSTKLPHVTRSDLIDINHIHTASLNGLANQFAIQNSLAPILNPIVDTQPANQQTNSRKPLATNNVSQFTAPLVTPNTAPSQPVSASPPASVALNEQTVTQLISELSNSQQASSRPPRPSANGAQFTSFTNSPTSASSTSTTRAQPASTSQASKFASFGSNLPATNQLGYDSSPLAATNSIVHSQGTQSSPGSVGPSPPAVLSSTATSVPTVSSSPAVTTSSMNLAGSSSTPGVHHGSHLQPASVLASFGQPGRTHNNLANAKYSLDGIIAVAIFGGFIFLGAIITIIVIIIRR